MKLKELTTLLKKVSEDGANQAFSKTGQLQEELSKAEAYRHYGRCNVDRWLLEGLVKISNKSIDRTKLESIAESSNRITYLPVAER